MRDILICTVGTSLFSNIRRGPEDSALRTALEKGNWIAVAKALLELDAVNRACGAEINSISSICNKEGIGRTGLICLVSDTDDGRNTGQVLKHYYRDQKNLCCFSEVTTSVIEGLQDNDPKAFRNQGLRNLVKEMANVIRKFGSDRVAVNATGGYKAQISFAGLISQALEIPVYYMFERFSAVIKLPPQPIAMNFDLWLENYQLLDVLDKQSVVKKSELAIPPDESLLALLDEEAINHDSYISLSPVGQLFHESFRYRFAKYRQSLLPRSVPEAKRAHPAHDPRIKNNDHLNHVGMDRLGPFLDKVFTGTPYVRGFHSFYTNPDLSEQTRFKLETKDDRSFILLIYSDHGKTAKLEVETETTDSKQLQAAVIDLNDRFLAS